MFFIVFTGLLMLLTLIGAVLVYRLYRKVSRTIQNLQSFSGILIDRVAKPLSNLPSLIEGLRNAIGLIRENISRERRSEDGEAN